MKEIKQYVLLVDNYRRPERQRNTAGRYRVAAKSEKEAIDLLREKIKFGSINLYYEDMGTPKHLTLPYKNVKREVFDGLIDNPYQSHLEDVHSAIDKQEVEEEFER